MSTRPLPPIERWQMPEVPEHWTVIPGWGVRLNAGSAEGANICLAEDTLLAGNSLEPYVRTQVTLLQRTFADPQIAGPAPTAMLESAGAEEGMLLVIGHRELDGCQIVQLQTYARIARWIGIATLTCRREHVASIRKEFEQFLNALRTVPQPEPVPHPR